MLSLHGEIARAWHLSPAGPVLLLGLLACAAALLMVAGTGSRAWRWFQRGALVYAGLAVTIWVSGWAAAFAAAWHSR